MNPLHATLSPAHFKTTRSVSPDPSLNLPDATMRIIDGYQPSGAGASTAWHHVRSFVVECVLAMHPSTPVNARRMMTMTALYVSWIWSVTGCQLSLQRVFQTHLIHRYVIEQLDGRAEVYQYDTVRQLATIAKRLAGIDVQRMSMPENAGGAKPYNSHELSQIVSWAQTLSTPFKRANARALIGLAGGAGLSAQELMEAQVENVHSTNGRLFVDVVGDRERTVPVRATWSRMLADSVEGRSRGDVFRAHRLEEYRPHGLQRFLTDNAGEIRPSASRLRAGWVVTQINSLLPLAVLLEITGFASLGSLQPYMKHAKQRQAADHLDFITGEVNS